MIRSAAYRKCCQHGRLRRAADAQNLAEVVVETWFTVIEALVQRNWERILQIYSVILPVSFGITAAVKATRESGTH